MSDRKNWGDMKRPSNPLGYVVVFKIPSRTNTEMVEHLVNENALSIRNVKTALGVDMAGAFEGCVVSFMCLTVWSVTTESVRRHLAQHGVEVVHIERMFRGAYVKSAEAKLCAVLTDLRNADAAGEPLPYDVILPVDPETGAAASAGVPQLKAPRSGSQPNRVRRPPINVDSTLVDSHSPPPGCVDDFFLSVFGAVSLAVRKLTKSKIPQQVWAWQEQGLGAPHSYFSNVTRAHVQQQQLQSDRFPMHDVAGQLFTTDKTKLARLFSFITEYHVYLSQRTDNATLKLHRMSTTIYLTTCMAVKLGQVRQESLMPLDLCHLYDIRVVPGCSAITQLEEETARKLTAAARFVLRHPNVTPEVAMTFVSQHALDWCSVVAKNVSTGTSQPGAIAAKMVRLFGRRNEPLTCHCGRGSESCADCYFCPFTLDGRAVAVAEAEAGYEDWLLRGRGGPEVPWEASQSFLRGASHVHLALRPAGKHSHASQVGQAVRERRRDAGAPPWLAETDVLLPSQLCCAWNDDMRRRWTWALAGSKQRKHQAAQERPDTPGEAPARGGMCISVSTAQGKSREAALFFDEARRDVPLIIPVLNWTDVSQLLHLLHAAHANHRAAPRAAVYCVSNHFLRDTADVAYRTWLPSPREPSLSDFESPAEETRQLAECCRSMLDCVTVGEAAPSKGHADWLPAPEWSVPATNVDSGGMRPVPLVRPRADRDVHALTRVFKYQGMANVATLVKLKNVVTTATETGVVTGQMTEGHLPGAPAKHAQNLGDSMQFPHPTRALLGSHPAECKGYLFTSASLDLSQSASSAEVLRGFLHACESLRPSGDGGCLALSTASAARLAAAVAGETGESADDVLAAMTASGVARTSHKRSRPRRDDRPEKRSREQELVRGGVPGGDGTSGAALCSASVTDTQ